jgi:hypothetical protein
MVGQGSMLQMQQAKQPCVAAPRRIRDVGSLDGEKSRYVRLYVDSCTKARALLMLLEEKFDSSATSILPKIHATQLSSMSPT